MLKEDKNLKKLNHGIAPWAKIIFEPVLCQNSITSRFQKPQVKHKRAPINENVRKGFRQISRKTQLDNFFFSFSGKRNLDS